MKITHYGHACVLVEINGVRALIDPGAYSDGFHDLRNLDVVLVTHKHADHLDADRLTILLKENPKAVVVTNADVAADLPFRDKDIVVTGGDTISVAGLTIEALEAQHALIHPLVPNVTSTGFVLDGRIWHPGDSFELDNRTVDVLLIPVGGPWMKLQEALDFQRAVAPRIAIPIHQAGLAPVHQQLHYGLLRSLAPEGTELIVLDAGIPRSF